MQLQYLLQTFMQIKLQSMAYSNNTTNILLYNDPNLTKSDYDCNIVLILTKFCEVFLHDPFFLFGLNLGSNLIKHNTLEAPEIL